MGPVIEDAPGQPREQGSSASPEGKCAVSPLPDSQAVAPEEAEALTRALERLPEAYRQVIQWRNRDRRSFEEIGQHLSQSPEAARRLWVRALESLARQL